MKRGAPRSVEPKFVERLQRLGLGALWAVLYCGHLGEARLKMDGQTYAALARHVLSTGDWRTLHYTSQVYPDFYNHPPLAIWIEALVFRAFGASEVTARIFPVLATAAATAGLYLLVRRSSTRFAAFLSVVVLLLSSRYIKYASDFYLDGPMAAALVWSAYAYLRSLEPGESRRRLGWAAAAGVFFGSAFMIKGVFSLALPAGIAGAAAVLAARDRGLAGRMALSLGALVLAAGATVLPWLVAGGGVHYLRVYFGEFVLQGVGTGGKGLRWTAVASLLKTYWPWVPAYFFGLFALVRGWRDRGTPLVVLVCGAVSVVFVAAFSFTHIFGEYHLVPFYPFAAVVVAWVLASRTSRHEARISAGLAAFAGAAALAIATLPIDVSGGGEGPAALLIRRAVASCDAGRVRKVVMDADSTDYWGGLAKLAWVTPWDAYVLPAASVKAEPGVILLARKGTAFPAGFEDARELAEPGYRLAQPAGSGLCALER